jgi:uncharacterized membrane protein
MVSAYEIYLLLHILAAVIWVGGAATAQVFAHRIVKGGSPAELVGFGKNVEWVGLRLYMPAGFVLLITGFLLVEDGDWSYDFWVIFGLVVFGLSFLAGALFFGPESGRIAKLVEQHGPEHAEVQRRLRRLIKSSRVELALLVAVVVDMVIKPFL